MIPDSQTNFLYLADTLSQKYPAFYERLEKVLRDYSIPFQLLPGTKDVWAVDFMPVQVRRKEFVQFVYNPDYLQTKEDIKSISDTETICKKIGIETIKTNIQLDGGNVVKSSNKVIMTDKIFKENCSFAKASLIKELEALFETDQLFFVPKQQYDYTGHSDGMLRFIDNDTLLVNDYQKESKWFREAFGRAIRKTGMNTIVLPYNPYENKSDDEANGTYINYLQMKKTVIVPVFNLKEDEAAVRKIEDVFKGNRIVTIEANEIAKDGGVLNCISWNILV